MRKTHVAMTLLTAVLLNACGGGGGGTSPGEQALKTTFSSMVSFGDSLSDVGTYAVGGIKAAGGGKFTINGNTTAMYPALTGQNWTELMATQFGLPAPCAAQTGLDGDAAAGLSVAVVEHPECLSYAQGGARVTNPYGPDHKVTGSTLGLLTMPVVDQVSKHLARTGGKFNGTEVVFVTAGANDVLALLGQLQGGAKAAGEAAAEYAAAQAPAAVTAMGAAGAELAGIVKTMIVANGANYVVVNNVPDLGGSPAGKAQDATTQALINTMVSTFNTQLKAGLADETKVVYVDLWRISHDQIINPGPYGLTNTSTPACTVKSLLCTGQTLIAGDVSHYMFADDVLPTPYENTLIAKYVAREMIIKGWL